MLRRRQAHPTPVWFSWALAAVTLYVVVYSISAMWSPNPVSGDALQYPYVDEPFHLALVGEFRHHFPAEIPFVDGTPLRYHWLVYPVMAAASWGSGVEPIVLVRVLMPAALSFSPCSGVAAAAARISGHRWAGIGAAIILTLTTPLDVFAWTPGASSLFGPRLAAYKSPTQQLANALCALLVVLLVGVLRRGARRPEHWFATFVVLLAVAGAKSAMLPLFIGGLCGAAIIMLVVHRRPPWVVGSLAGLSILAFGVASVVFYGSGSRAMSLSPFQVIENRAGTLGLAPPGETPSGVVLLGLTLVFLVCLAAPTVGAVALFLHGGWRRPVPWMLLGTCAAGVAAYLGFRHPSFAEVYFLRSAVIPLALLGGLGWARAVGPVTRRTAGLTALFTLAGLGWAFLVPTLVDAPTPRGSTGSDLARTGRVLRGAAGRRRGWCPARGRGRVAAGSSIRALTSSPARPDGNLTRDRHVPRRPGRGGQPPGRAHHVRGPEADPRRRHRGRPLAAGTQQPR